MSRESSQTAAASGEAGPARKEEAGEALTCSPGAIALSPGHGQRPHPYPIPHTATSPPTLPPQPHTETSATSTPGPPYPIPAQSTTSSQHSHTTTTTTITSTTSPALHDTLLTVHTADLPPPTVPHYTHIPFLHSVPPHTLPHNSPPPSLHPRPLPPSLHVPFIQGRPGTAPRLEEHSGTHRGEEGRSVTDYVRRRKWRKGGRKGGREGRGEGDV
ncbi:hypothetical protein E2C01_050936 [Portunus trituberculatus]|uniref:Uncharacterized protein n=1 Tax=Portunus trituberculatus TaxID=210409 RepID=A0A5B7GI86_PORTR|nr:hypothetical protein [Portunus trituberculatus]